MLSCCVFDIGSHRVLAHAGAARARRAARARPRCCCDDRGALRRALGFGRRHARSSRITLDAHHLRAARRAGASAAHAASRVLDQTSANLTLARLQIQRMDAARRADESRARRAPRRARCCQCTTRSKTNSPPSTSTGITSFGPKRPSRISLATGFSMLLLDRALQRPRAEHRIEADLGQLRQRRAARRRASSPSSPAAPRAPCSWIFAIASMLLRVERVEHHRLVDAVQELGAEVLLDLDPDRVADQLAASARPSA